MFSEDEILLSGLGGAFLHGLDPLRTFELGVSFRPLCLTPNDSLIC